MSSRAFDTPRRPASGSSCPSTIPWSDLPTFAPDPVGYRIPAGGFAQQSERMLVTLQHPDAVRPKDFGDSADDRQLAFAISEARLHRVASPKRSSEYQLPAGLMLGAITQRDAGPPPDLREWAMAQTGLTIPQIRFHLQVDRGKLRSSLFSSSMRC